MRVIVPDFLLDSLAPRMRALKPDVELIPLAADGSQADSLDDAEVLLRFYL